jgi:hypothetical protein
MIRRQNWFCVDRLCEYLKVRGSWLTRRQFIKIPLCPYKTMSDECDI